MTEPANPHAATAVLTITRVFDAPRERVWKEWTEPERFADWFGGAECEVPLSGIYMDVRPGGSWRALMHAGPGRDPIRWKGEFREVVEPERLVLTFSDQPEGDALRAGHRRPRGPRRRPHGDALRAAWRDGARAVRGRRGGLGDLLRPHGRAPGTLELGRTPLPARVSAKIAACRRTSRHSSAWRRSSWSPRGPTPRW